MWLVRRLFQLQKWFTYVNIVKFAQNWKWYSRCKTPWLTDSLAVWFKHDARGSHYPLIFTGNKSLLCPLLEISPRHIASGIILINLSPKIISFYHENITKNILISFFIMNAVHYRVKVLSKCFHVYKANINLWNNQELFKTSLLLPCNWSNVSYSINVLLKLTQI